MTKSRLYTRRGDEGYTSLAGGKRIEKNNLRIDTYGTIDELNSFIALLLEEIHDPSDRQFLFETQSNLFSVGGYLASEPGSKDCTVSDEIIASLEKEIDIIDALVPPIRAFILPGGCKENALSHICRTICRRAERRINKLNKIEEVDERILRYINRLSDYFFIFARKQSLVKNVEEILWKNPCK